MRLLVLKSKYSYYKYKLENEQFHVKRKTKKNFPQKDAEEVEQLAATDGLLLLKSIAA